MERTDFEGDVDFSVTEVPFGRDKQGGVLNIAPADTFGPGVSADVEGLLFLGYLTDHFELWGHSFTIRTLRRGERLAIAQIVQDWENTLGYADAFQTAYVAACMMEVDNRPLAMPLEPGEEKRPLTWIRRNFEIVNRWFDPVIEQVYEKYSNLLNRQTLAFIELQGK